MKNSEFAAKTSSPSEGRTPQNTPDHAFWGMKAVCSSLTSSVTSSLKKIVAGDGFYTEILVAAAVVLLLQGQVAFCDDNLIWNGSFEEELSTNAAKDKGICWTPMNENATAFISPGGKDGQHCVEITKVRPGGFWIEQFNVVVKPNTSYFFTCWIKTDITQTGPGQVGSAHDATVWVTENGAWNDKPYVQIIQRGSQDWTKYSQVFTTGGEAKRLMILLGNHANSGTVYYDGVLLREATAEDEEKGKSAVSWKNILPNPDFKKATNPGMPDNWYPCSAYYGERLFWNEKAQNSWAIDETNSYQGNPSLRIELLPEKNLYPPMDVRALSSSFNMSSGSFRVRLFAKSNLENGEVAISGWGNCGCSFNKLSQPVVGKDWKEYIVEGEAKSEGDFTLCVYFPLDKPGVYWLNNVRLEQQVASGVVSREQGQTGPASGLPRLEMARCTAPPVIDGSLNEEAWKGASVISQFNDIITGKPANEKTTVRLMMDKDNIYVAFECFDKDADKLVAAVDKRDGAVWNDDSVEIFLSLTSDRYFHFAINSKGVIFDQMVLQDAETKGKTFDPRWNSLMRAAVSRNGKGWLLETVIPLACLDVGSQDLNNLQLRANFFRHNPKTGEYSAWRPSFGTSHNYDRFGYIGGLFPSDLAPFNVKISDMVLSEQLSGNYSLSFNLFSVQSKGKISVKASIKGKEFFGESEIKPEIINQVILTSFPRDILSCLEKDPLFLQVFISGAPVYSGMFDIKDVGIRKCFDCYLAKSYYTDEPQAKIILKGEANKRDRILLTCKGETRDVTSSISEGCILVNIKDWPAGEETLTVQLTDGTSPLLARQLLLIKRPPAPMAVKILREDTPGFEVNGRPVILTGFTFTAKDAAEWDKWYKPYLQEYKERWHCNFQGIFCKTVNLDFVRKLADDIHNAGMYTEFNPEVFNDVAQEKLYYEKDFAIPILSAVEGLKKHPAMIGSIYLDEPECWWMKMDKGAGKKESDIIDLYRRLQEKDPYHFFGINYTDQGVVHPLEGFGATDVLSFDAYPFGSDGGGWKRFVDCLRHLNTLGKTQQKPVANYIQCFGKWQWTREPTPAEMRAQVYASVILGSRKITAFGPITRYRPTMEALGKAYREVQELTPVFYAPDISRKFLCSDEGLVFTARECANILYLIGFNNTSGRRAFCVVAPVTASTHRVTRLFENEARPVDMDNNLLNLDLDRYEVIVLKISKRELNALENSKNAVQISRCFSSLPKEFVEDPA